MRVVVRRWGRFGAGGLLWFQGSGSWRLEFRSPFEFQSSRKRACDAHNEVEKVFFGACRAQDSWLHDPHRPHAQHHIYRIQQPIITDLTCLGPSIR